MKFYGLYLISRDPLIFSCFGGGYEEQAVYNIKQPAEVLFHPTWLWTARSMPWAVARVLQRSRSGKNPHFIASAGEEQRRLQRLGLPAQLSSICAYINENDCGIIDCEKKYDAIYCAQMVGYKRMELAAEITSLFIQTYGKCKNAAGEFDLHSFAPQIRHCDFNTQFLKYDAVIENINRARVGLALSAREGAMLASVEYMLCGLPVVSTRSRGGRDEFYDERYVRIVDPDPGAVAAAVQELISLKLDPQLIRSETLKKIRAHRERFCNYALDLIRKYNGAAPAADEMYDKLYNSPLGIHQHYIHRYKFREAGFEIYQEPPNN